MSAYPYATPNYAQTAYPSYSYPTTQATYGNQAAYGGYPQQSYTATAAYPGYSQGYTGYAQSYPGYGQYPQAYPQQQQQPAYNDTFVPTPAQQPAPAPTPEPVSSSPAASGPSLQDMMGPNGGFSPEMMSALQGPPPAPPKKSFLGALFPYVEGALALVGLWYGGKAVYNGLSGTPDPAPPQTDGDETGDEGDVLKPVGGDTNTITPGGAPAFSANQPIEQEVAKAAPKPAGNQGFDNYANAAKADGQASAEKPIVHPNIPG